MPFMPHTKVSFGGRLLGALTADIWNCSVNVTDTLDFSLPLADPGAYMEQIATPLATWYASELARNSNLASLAYVKVNNIGADGHYSDPASTHRHDYTTDIRGNGSSFWPEILSVCISWRTAKTRGPGSHGRIYLPNPTIVSQNSLMVDDSARVSYCTAGKNLLTVLKNAGGPISATPVVSSKVNATNTPITAISVGSVGDVQRRRKSAEKEIYTTVAL
jgi:hypothetical protein